MISAGRKTRGMATQVGLAEYLRAHGFPWATDAGPGRPGTDILNAPGLSIEVKARADFNPLTWLREAASRPGLPLVVWRPNGYGLTRIEEWPVMTMLGPGVETLRAAGYGDPQ